MVLNVRKGKNPRFNLRKNPRVGGLSVGEPDGILKFYPLPNLEKQRVINDSLDGTEIVVVFDPNEWVFAAFERGGRFFAWKNGKMIDKAGKQWNHLKGTSGDLTLRPIPAVIWLTSAWRKFYPEGEVYSGK